MASYKIIKKERMLEKIETDFLEEQSSEGFELVTIINLGPSGIFNKFKYIFKKDEGDDNKK